MGRKRAFEFDHQKLSDPGESALTASKGLCFS